MNTLAIIVVAGVLSVVCVKTNYDFLKYMAGFAWWGLGIWWVFNPIVSGSSPVNDAMVVIAFFAGLAFMLLPMWSTRTVNGREVGSFNIRLPSILGGRSEEEEEALRGAGDIRTRNERYRTRLNNAIRGRR